LQISLLFFNIASKLFTLTPILVVLREIQFGVWSSVQVTRRPSVSDMGSSQTCVGLVSFSEADPSASVTLLTFLKVVVKVEWNMLD
jgi:hypothetical protein